MAFFGALTGQIPLKAATKAEKQLFNIKSDPTKEDWKAFNQLNEFHKIKLWQEHSKKGEALSDWFWKWRFAWLRSCQKIFYSSCKEITAQGIEDRAAVVRNLAVDVIGTQYAGTSDRNAVRLLEKCYKNPKNIRAGKPLFIQRHILFALRKVGGKEAMSKGMNLSQSNKDMSKYWSQLKPRGKAAF